MLRVFISYNHEDKDTAEKVHKCVEGHPGYSAYMAKIDDKGLEEEDELAKRLRDEISRCRRIIAVISDYTRLSWWVPWEIGVGYGKEYNIASYIERHDGSMRLPGYLREWPILRDLDEVNMYCQMSRMSSAGVTQRRLYPDELMALYRSAPRMGSIRSAMNHTLRDRSIVSSERFHKKLKQWLIERRGF